MKPVLIDLFCGVGGATRGYQLAGFYVIGVDHRPQPRYCGDEFIQADAMTFPLDGAHCVHASPPCKRFTVASRVHEVIRPTLFDRHDDLLTPMLERLRAHGAPFIVENVPGAPMPDDSVTLCGSSFGLQVRRHRLFASNVPIVGSDCRHDLQPYPVGVYGNGGAWRRTAPGGGGVKVAGRDAAIALGIDWTEYQPELDVTEVWQHTIEWDLGADARQMRYMWVKLTAGDIAREVVGIGRFRTRLVGAA